MSATSPIQTDDQQEDQELFSCAQCWAEVPPDEAFIPHETSVPYCDDICYQKAHSLGPLTNR